MTLELNQDSFDFSADHFNVKKFLQTMKDAGGTGSFDIKFDGSHGTAYLVKPDLSQDQKECASSLGYAFDKHTYIKGEMPVADPTDKTVELMRNIKNIIPFDFINDLGGFGVVTLDIDNGLIHLSYHVRTVVITAHATTF